MADTSDDYTHNVTPDNHHYNGIFVVCNETTHYWNHFKEYNLLIVYDANFDILNHNEIVTSN